MAVKTKEEMLESVKKIIGENDTDDAITLLEDISDTYDDFSKNSGDDWKSKYEENDKAWRKKYSDRFFEKRAEEKEDETLDDEEVEEEKLTYDDLFTEGERKEKDNG